VSDEPLADIRIGATYDRASGRRVTGLQGPIYDARVRRRVILVHGFNAAPEGTSRSYDSFRREVRKVAPRLNRDIWTVSWPGRALYWNAVTRASGPVATVLAEHLEQTARSQLDQLVFVAHSLGCRLVLEALAQLSVAAGAIILPRTRLFLLAAAVPTRTVDSGGDLRRVVGDCDRPEVFYSWRDEALGPAFTALQFQDQGAWTQAVGLFGEPADLWGRRRHHMVGYGHSAYWPSANVAYRIALSLRAVEHRPDWRTAPKARRRTPTRSLLARALGRRELPARRAP
jgi:pimeloyl-ACP methyl ester carboxylesterase